MEITESAPPPERKPSPLAQIVKQVKNQHRLTPDSLLYLSKLRSRDQPILGHPRRTKPIIWFAAILCMLFIILLIIFAIATIIIFAVVQPKTPVLDTPAASLGAISFNYPEYLNGDITFLANFSNPNRKLNVRYEYLHIELYFSERLMAAQVLQPFSQRPRTGRLVSVRMLSSLIYPPPNLAMELQKQEVRNRVVYNIKATFRVKVKLGSVHYHYWLHGDCWLEMTSPPNSVLISHNCRTKR